MSITVNAPSDRAISKARTRILPFLILMYVLAFVDRSNVGFAKDMLQADAGIGNAAYAFGAGAFFLSYALFEVPSNLIMYRVGARLWLSRIMVTWGVIAACMALTHDPVSFYILRFLLGIAEAGFFPGIILYLTLWFPARARAQTMGLFYFGLPLSLVIGGPLSGLCLDMDAPLGLRPWQFMFIVEGLMASIVGVIAFFYLTDHPGRADWLGEEERAALTALLDQESEAKIRGGPHSLLAAIGDPRVLIYCLIYFAVQMSVYGVIFYLPARIAALMGEQVGVRVGLVTAIPWLVAIAVTYAVTKRADRYGLHRQFAAVMLTMAALGIAASIIGSSLPMAILAFCFAASGFVSVQPLFWTIPTAYLGGATAAGGIGLINAIGNLGGFVAPNMKNFFEHAVGRPQAGMLSLAMVGIAGAVLLAFALPGKPSSSPI